MCQVEIVLICMQDSKKSSNLVSFVVCAALFWVSWYFAYVGHYKNCIESRVLYVDERIHQKLAVKYEK